MAAGNHLGRLYFDPETFVGRRTELQQISNRLNPHDIQQQQRRVVLCGIGGIGKTQIALAFAKHPARQNVYSSVFWLNAASRATLDNSLRKIASTIFETETTRNVHGEDLLDRIHRWLSDTANTNWLLIFDNYDNQEEFDIEQFYPSASHGAIIVTTRLLHDVAGEKILIKSFDSVEEGLEVLHVRSKRAVTKTGTLSTATARHLS